MSLMRTHELNSSPEINPNAAVPEKTDGGISRLEQSQISGPERTGQELPDDSGIREQHENLPDDSGVDYSISKRLDKESDSEKQNTSLEEAPRKTDDVDRPAIHGEARELSQIEINKKQREVIKNTILRLFRGEKLTTEEKGNLCEMMMDQYFISLGYTPIQKHRVTDLNDKGHHGIDGVYEKKGQYIIADAKYGFAKLQETQDGMQMSKEWIDRRLDDAVGKEKADEIRDAYEEDPSSVKALVYHYDPNPDGLGQTHSDVYQVDESGQKNGDTTVVEIYQDGMLVDTTNGGRQYA